MLESRFMDEKFLGADPAFSCDSEDEISKSDNRKGDGECDDPFRQPSERFLVLPGDEQEKGGNDSEREIKQQEQAEYCAYP